jgi:hypothetical protein
MRLCWPNSLSHIRSMCVYCVQLDKKLIWSKSCLRKIEEEQKIKVLCVKSCLWFWKLFFSYGGISYCLVINANSDSTMSFVWFRRRGGDPWRWAHDWPTPSVASIVAAVYELHPRLAVPWPSLLTRAQHLPAVRLALSVVVWLAIREDRRGSSSYQSVGSDRNEKIYICLISVLQCRSLSVVAVSRVAHVERSRPVLIVSLHATLRSRGMIVCYELDYDVAPRFRLVFVRW